MARRTGGRLKAAMFGAVSLTAAAVAVAIVYTAVGNLRTTLDELKAPPETIPVVVARADLPPGTTITAEHLALVEIEADYVPRNAMSNPDDVVGRVTRERVLASDLLRKERLARINGGDGIEALIPQGYRAMSIDLSDGARVSGFLEPGNLVDVLATSQDEESVLTTEVKLQAVRVLAVDNRIASGQTLTAARGVRPSVTLMVTPAEVEQLAHAQAEGPLTLTLRNDIDLHQGVVGVANWRDLVGERVEPQDTMIGKAPVKATELERTEDGSLFLIRGARVESATVALPW